MQDASQDCNEEWRPVVGYEGWYEVSSLGRVRRVMAKKATPFKVLRPGTNWPRRGYMHVLLSKGEPGGKGRKTYYLHRLVAEAFIGPRPGGYQINHIDGNKANNSAANLEYVTRQENHDHAVREGLRKRGSGLGSAKLTEEQVARIRNEFAGMSSAKIGASFGVSRSTILRVLHNESWQHVPCDTVPPKRIPSSKYRGVYYLRNERRWHAFVKVGGHVTDAGNHITEEGAARAHDRKALLLLGDDAKLNFPEDAANSLREALEERAEMEACIVTPSGRRVRPWLRKSTGRWYISWEGKQINLGENREQVEQKYREIKAGLTPKGPACAKPALPVKK